MSLASSGCLSHPLASREGPSPEQGEQAGGGRGLCSEQAPVLSQSIFPRISLICTFLFLCDVTIALS